ncbi:hypothetical protein MWU59_08295 [Flavobacteriaceae bacterium F08102]|nr:hypothetical protein [Flavobacteriaceae bacterium F08102]
MESSILTTLLSFTIPTIVTGIIALYFFKEHTKNEDKRRSYLLRKDRQNIALPLRLQAYERMSIFLERISPQGLIVRVTPSGDDKVNYEKKLNKTIEQEFEHNLAQQIYLSPECWNVIVTSKNAIINMIRNTMADKEITNAQEMRERILQKASNMESPTSVALSYIKNEVHKLF